MGIKKEDYVVFPNKQILDQYTASYEEVYTGFPRHSLDFFADKLLSASQKQMPWFPEFDEQKIKEFYGFPGDPDIYRIAKDFSVFSFVNYYCGGNYYNAINEYLRFGKTHFPSCFNLLKTIEPTTGSIALERALSPEEVVEMMNDVFCRYPTKNDMVLWRALRVNKNFENPFGKFFKKEYTEKGFLSCGSVLDNLLKSGEYDDCSLVLKLYVPKGTPSLYLDHISNRSHETEWLLPPGTVIKQISRPQKYDGKLIVECTIEVEPELLKKRDFYESRGLTHQPTYYAQFLKEQKTAELKPSNEIHNEQKYVSLDDRIQQANAAVLSNKPDALGKKLSHKHSR